MCHACKVPECHYGEYCQPTVIDDNADCEVQALAYVTRCVAWKCLEFSNGQMIGPSLVVDHRSNLVCPKCKASYGKPRPF